MPTEKLYPMPTSVEVNALTGTGTGPVTLVPAVAGKIGLVWACQQVLGATTGVTIRSGSTNIDALPTTATRGFLMPVGDPLTHIALPVWQGYAANEAITMQFATSNTYSIKVYYSYVDEHL